jgi:uncharacterized membrane protein
VTFSVPTRGAVLQRARARAIAAGAGVIAAGAELPGALHDAFWQDEVASARVISEPHAVGMLQHVARTESTPPLWYALGWTAHHLGAGVQDVRLLSVAMGAALAALVVRTAERLVPLWAAGVAGLGAAVGYQFVFHGRELRAYELAALLAVAIAAATLEAARAPTVRRLSVLGLLVAAGTLTHYFVVLSVASVGAWVLLVPLARRVRRRLLAALAAGLAPLAAWAPVAAQQAARHRFSFIGAFRLRDVATTYWFFFARARPQTPLLRDAAPLALLVAVLAGAVLLFRTSDAARLWALLAVGPVAAAAVLWLGGVQIYDVRNLIVSAPFAAVCAVAPGARIRRPQAAAAAATVACALLVAAFVAGGRVAPVAYDRIAAELVSHGWRPGDPIRVRGDAYALAAPLEWYLPHRPRLTLETAPVRDAERCFTVDRSLVAQTACPRRGAVLVSERRR